MRKSTEIPIEEFHARVRNHLARAAELLPDAVPGDVFDPAITPMMDELQSLDELLFGLGHEERALEERETSRERKVEAKHRDATLEERAMRVDRNVQTAMKALGGPPGLFSVLLPMEVDCCANSFILFLDAMPASAFAEGRPVPPTFPSLRDETVAGLITLMRERKAREAARSG